MLKKLLFTLSLPCLLVPFPTGAAESSPEREAKQFYRNFDLRDHEKPAPLQPPFTLGPAEVAAARKNLERYPWARKLLASLRRQADDLLAIPVDRLPWHIPDEPGASCCCPACGQVPEVAWRGPRNNDGHRLLCADCGTVFPNPDYPEDKTFQLKLANGRKLTLHYYEGKSIKLNEGKRYFISGVIRERRTRILIDKLPALSALYALEGDRKIAQQARNILLRFAEVYPGYPPRLRNSYYSRYGKNPIEGKFYRWKFGDSQYMVKMATLYDVTRHSDVYTDEDRVKIENGLFREYKRMMVAFPPWRDLTNSLPYGYAGMAHVGRLLGDHEMIAWVVSGPQSLENFMAARFHRDGFWHEDTCSYQNMTLGSMHLILTALAGYSDPADYQGKDRFDRLDPAASVPMLGKAYVAQFHARMPDGALPALNDSVAYFQFRLCYAEHAWRYFRLPEAKAILDYAQKDGEKQSGSLEELFRDPPESDVTAPAPLPAFVDRSRIMPGPRWMILWGSSGPQGSALVLDNGENTVWHVHNSSLNFLYFDYGRELVTDMGYLSAQHQLTPFNKSPIAHQTVLVDGVPHTRAPDRCVESDFFAGKDTPIQAVRGHAPNVYPEVTSRFERTLFYVNRGPGQRYAVDFFEVQGGKSHLYVFHAVGEDFRTPELPLKKFDLQTLGDKSIGTPFLTDGRSAPVTGPQNFIWYDDTKDGIGTVFRLPKNWTGEFLTARAPGNRDFHKPLSDKKMHLLMLRRQGPENCFAGVLEGFSGAPTPREVELFPAQNGRALRVVSPERTEWFFSSNGQGPLTCAALPGMEMRARAGAVILEKGIVKELFVVGGTIRCGGKELAAPEITGHITAFDEKARTITLDQELPESAVKEYLYLPAYRDGFYRIEAVNGKTVTLTDTAPYHMKPQDTFHLIPSAFRNY